MVIGLITGQNILGYHIIRIGIRNDDICRLGGKAVFSKNSYNFLCPCPAVCHRRKNILGFFFFQRLVELHGRNPKKIWALIKSAEL